MATAFRIHEDIENVLDAAQKKDHHHKNTGKNDQKLDKQPLRSTFAILNNVNNDNGRNVAAANTAHAQKTVRQNNNNKPFDHIVILCTLNALAHFQKKHPLLLHDRFVLCVFFIWFISGGLLLKKREKWQHFTLIVDIFHMLKRQAHTILFFSLKSA